MNEKSQFWAKMNNKTGQRWFSGVELEDQLQNQLLGTTDNFADLTSIEITITKNMFSTKPAWLLFLEVKSCLKTYLEVF